MRKKAASKTKSSKKAAATRSAGSVMRKLGIVAKKPRRGGY